MGPGPMGPTPMAPTAPIAPTTPTMTAATVQVGANDLKTVKLLCRGIKRPGTANVDLAYAVKQALTNSPSFTNVTELGNIELNNGDTNTFTFTVTVDLRHPFKL